MEDMKLFADILKTTIKHTHSMYVVYTRIINQLPTLDYRFGLPNVVLRRVQKRKCDPPNFQQYHAKMMLNLQSIIDFKFCYFKKLTSLTFLNFSCYSQHFESPNSVKFRPL